MRTSAFDFSVEPRFSAIRQAGSKLPLLPRTYIWPPSCKVRVVYPAFPANMLARSHNHISCGRNECYRPFSGV